MNSVSAPISPPTRTENDENFPVVFHLLPKDKRSHVLAYYHFARTADDIADSSELSAEQKLAGLNAMEASLLDQTKPYTLSESFAATGVPTACATDLLKAFRWDAQNRSYQTWNDLLEYCRFSAEPVGRYLLALHDEASKDAKRASDALSTALQLINHIQDCRKDLRDMDRLYVPTDWMTELGVSREDLLGKTATGSIRALLDRMLDGVDQLLEIAELLPRKVKNRGLRSQAAVTLACGKVLRDRLRKGDPLTTRIDLSKSDKARLALIGGFRGVLGL